LIGFFPLKAVLDICIEILAAPSEEDGVTRWLDSPRWGL
jgi:hypothetical protein